MTTSDKPSSGQRKRGVRASRAKLVHALTEAGFRTQAALADHLADLEGLDAAPKDLVNRAFRELPVDPQTLDRIAIALKVEAHTLYKAATDVDPPKMSPAPIPPVDPAGDPPGDETEEATAKRSSASAAGVRSPGATVVWVAVAGLIALTAAWWFRDAPPDKPASAEPAKAATTTGLSMGPLSLVVLPLENDTADLTGALRTSLSEHFNVATPTALTAAQSDDPQELTERLRVDRVLSTELQSAGSMTGIRVYQYENDTRQLLWAESFATRRLSAQRDALAHRVTQALLANDTNPPFYPTAQAQDDYLQGRFHLEQPTSELNVKRAQSRFSSAIRQLPRYARAHAGLCMALLEEFWMDDEERALSDASRTCGEALSLAPNDALVNIAHAFFLRRSGRIEDAIATFDAVIEQDSGNALALDGLASSLLDSYRQSGDEAQLGRAIEVANQSVAANPNTWRPYNTLLSLNWFAGDIPGAISAAERSLEFDENELLLVNLGTMHLCTGNLEQARSNYQRAIEFAPGSYMGIEFLGQAMYFLGDFERSAELRRTAIESIGDGEPEIHEMWGNLGDSFRQTGDTAGAIGAYLQASKIAERDHLRGNAAIADRASRAYYYTMLRSLDRDTVSDDVYNSMRAELDQISDTVTEPSALRRLAQTWLTLGETDKAKQTLGKVTQTCPGYALMPDLLSLSGDG